MFLSTVIRYHCHLQILELKKKQESQVELSKQKQKSDEAAKRLQAEIQYIKAQKVSFIFLAFPKFRSDLQDGPLYIDNFGLYSAFLFFMCRFSCRIR